MISVPNTATARPVTDTQAQVDREFLHHEQDRDQHQSQQQPFWGPWHLLSAVDNLGLLDWDSYVELRQLVRFPPDDVKQAIAQPGSYPRAAKP